MSSSNGRPEARAVVGVPGVAGPIPDARLPAEQLCRALLRPIHWFYHLEVVCAALPVPAHRQVIPPTRLAELAGFLGLDGPFTVTAREFFPGEYDRITTSDVAFHVEPDFSTRSYQLPLAVALAAARLRRPLPPWVALTGALEEPLASELRLTQTGGIDEKIRLCLGLEGYDLGPLLERLYLHDSTPLRLGPRRERVVSRKVRLLVVPQKVDVVNFRLLPAPLRCLPVALRPGKLACDDFDQLAGTLQRLAGDDLLVVQVPTVAHALHLLGYRGRWSLPAGAEQATLPAFRIGAADAAALERSSVAQHAQIEQEALEAVLRRTPDVHQKLTSILERCARLLGCHAANLAIEEPAHAGRWLRVWACWGDRMEQLPPYSSGEEGINREVLQSGELAIWPDYPGRALDSRLMAAHYPPETYDRYLDVLSHVGSCAAFPFRLNDRVVGVVPFHHRQRGPFDPQALQIVEHLIGLAEREVTSYLRAIELFHGRRTPVPVLVRQSSRPPDPEDLREIGDELAAEALRLTGAYRTAVRLRTRHGRSLRVIGLAGEAGAWPADFTQRRFSLQEPSAASRAVRSGQTFVILDCAGQTVDYFPIEPSATCHASVVLRTGARVLGVLSIDWDRPRSQEAIALDVDAVERLVAGPAGILRTFIVNRLRRELDAWFGALRPEAVPDYPRLLEVLAALVGTDRGSLFLAQPGTGRYRLRASLTHPDWTGESHWYRRGEGATGWVIEHNAPLRLADLGDDHERQRIRPRPPTRSKYHHLWDAEKHGMSFLGVPVSQAGNVLGVIRLVSKFPRSGSSPHGFDDYDERVLEAEAARLAGFLAQRRGEQRQRLLHGLPRTLFAGGDGGAPPTRNDLIEQTALVLHRGIGESTRLALRVVDHIERSSGEVETVLDRLAVRGFSWDVTPDVVWPGEGVVGQVWQGGKRRVVHDAHHGPEAEDLRAFLGGQDWPAASGCFACVPLFAGEGAPSVIGTLGVHQEEPHALAPDDVEFIERVANLTALALRLLAFHEERQLQEDLLRAVNDYHLRRGGGAEASLVRQVGLALGRALGAALCRAWHLSEDGRFHDPAGDQPELAAEDVERVMGGRRFLVVSCPAEDGRLGGLPLDRAADGLQRALLRVEAGGLARALFFVAVEPPARLRYSMVERADRLLAGTVAPALEAGWQGTPG
jgi:putative methionine-R-sulfoxide reductase with GAF domain